MNKKTGTTKQQKRIADLQRQLAAAKKKPSARNGPARGRGGRGGRVPKNLITPFDSAPGAKVPDQASARSLTFRSRNQFTLVPDQGTGTSRNAVAITTSHVNNIYGAPTYTGSDVSAWGTATPSQFYTTNGAAADRVRIVNFGVRVRSVGAALNAQGILTVYTNYHAASISGGALSLASSPVNAAETAASKMVYPINSLLDVEFNSQPLDNDAFVYEAIGGQNKSWSWPTFHVTGGSADVSLLFEVRFDVEWQAFPNNSVSAYSSDSADYNPGLMARMYNLYRSLPPVHQVANVAVSAARGANAVINAGRTIRQFGESQASQPLLQWYDD